MANIIISVITFKSKWAKHQIKQVRSSNLFYLKDISFIFFKFRKYFNPEKIIIIIIIKPTFVPEMSVFKLTVTTNHIHLCFLSWNFYWCTVKLLRFYVICISFIKLLLHFCTTVCSVEAADLSCVCGLSEHTPLNYYGPPFFHSALQSYETCSIGRAHCTGMKNYELYRVH